MEFDPKTVEDNDSFSPLPEGDYKVAVLDGELKTTKAGNGTYVAMSFAVASGPHKDRRIFSNFNIENPSEKATQIGRAQFKRFLAALGIVEKVSIDPAFFRKLQNKTLLATVDHEVGQDGKTRERVRRFDSTQQLASVPQQQRKAAPSLGSVAADIPPPGDTDNIPF